MNLHKDRSQIVIALFLSLFIFSCARSPKEEEDENRKELDARVQNNSDSTLSESEKYFLENLKVEYGDEIMFQGSSKIIIPIVLDQIYEEKGESFNKYFNIAVLDSVDAEPRMLFEESVVIEELVHYNTDIIEDYYSHPDDYERNEKRHQDSLFSSYKNLLFMEVWDYKERERNKRSLFIYNLEMDSLYQVNPEDFHVSSWQVIPFTSKMLVNISFDSNKDGLYDYKDDQNYLVYDPNNPSKAEPKFDLAELKRLKLIVAKQNKIELKE